MALRRHTLPKARVGGQRGSAHTWAPCLPTLYAYQTHLYRRAITSSCSVLSCPFLNTGSERPRRSVSQMNVNNAAVGPSVVYEYMYQQVTVAQMSET